ncbi:hypothetical protein [Soonwooa buanensis]|nr:hypothetical protein [Soonwooa buanensis]
MTKNIIILSILLAFTSCKKEESVSNLQNSDSTTISKNIVKDTLAQPIELKEIPQDPHDILDTSFIGKTTIEINKLNIHECFGMLLEDNEQKFAIAKYSNVVDDCFKGKNKILFEKFMNYYDNGKANFKIVDELNVITNHPKTYFNAVHLTLDGSEKVYLAEYEDSGKESITRIYKIWKIDFDVEKFVEIKVPQNLTFLNPEYAEE